MTDGRFKDVPVGLVPPIELSGDNTQFAFWEGETELRQKSRGLKGIARIYVDLYPAPEFRFEFTPHQSPSLIEAWFESELGEATINCGPPFGEVLCNVSNAGANFSGYVESQSRPIGSGVNAHKAVYIVINGPSVHGGPLKRGSRAFTGRLQSSSPGHGVIVDALKSEAMARGAVYEPTHVACCEFSNAASLAEIEKTGTHLFRVLSLMKCRWTGLLGPWLYDSFGNLVEIQLSVTKTMRNGGASSWFHEMMGSSFGELYQSMQTAFEDEKREPALQTAIHWLIESEQCAGGVEGAIILQQSALECLAWLEIVLIRKLCSESGFKALPASDKIRWLLSINNICADIPAKSAAIISYAKAFNLSNLVEVLVDVRNALVHAEPKKVERLFSRNNGEEERGDLWYQAGGMLQQAFLAAIGYEGKLLRRDLDCEYATQATKPAPWAKNK